MLKRSVLAIFAVIFHTYSTIIKVVATSIHSTSKSLHKCWVSRELVSFGDSSICYPNVDLFHDYHTDIKFERNRILSIQVQAGVRGEFHTIACAEFSPLSIAPAKMDSS